MLAALASTRNTSCPACRLAQGQPQHQGYMPQQMGGMGPPQAGGGMHQHPHQHHQPQQQVAIEIPNEVRPASLWPVRG